MYTLWTIGWVLFGLKLFGALAWPWTWVLFPWAMLASIVALLLVLWATD